MCVCVHVWALKCNHTNLIPLKESYAELHSHFDILRHEMQPFWRPHADNPTTNDANFVSNWHDHFRYSPRSDISKWFHALLILGLRFCIIFDMVFFGWLWFEWRRGFEWNETKAKEKKTNGKNNINFDWTCLWVSIYFNIERYCIQRERTSRKIKGTTSQSNKIHYFLYSKYTDQWKEQNSFGLHLNSKRKIANQTRESQVLR